MGGENKHLQAGMSLTEFVAKAAICQQNISIWLEENLRLM
jgi:hypothetical protein